MFDKKEFADILKKINSTYSTMTEFAQKACFDRTYISKYINMKLDNPPTPKVLKKIANASNGITDYTELMLICNYLNNDMDKLMGDTTVVYNNPYTVNLKYNNAQNFIFDVIYSYENLENLDCNDDEKKHIIEIYSYIKKNKAYSKLMKEYEKLKKNSNKNEQLLKPIDDVLNEAMIGMSKEEYEALNETQKKQIRDFAIFVKNQNEGDKK